MSVKCILTEQIKSSSIDEDVILQSIAITTPPTKKIYEDGETFDPTGMVVTGTYYVASQDIYITAEITAYNISPRVLTTGTSQVTISYSEGSHSANAIQPIVVTSWEWGSETATADANWFQGLQAMVQAGGADNSWVGKTKSVTLTSSVLGATTHFIRCIGVNQDGNNTVTFQTKNCLPTTTTFGSNAQWIGSTARTQCTNYYNAFPGKAYIKTVSKGTCTNASDSTATYNDETVWIPSIYEVGLSNFSYKPTGAEYTNGCSTAYSYYSSDTNRIKYENDSSSTACHWWTRSRSSRNLNYACIVYPGGSAGDYRYGNSYRLAPAFVIG